MATMASQFEAASFSFSNLSADKTSLPDKVSLYFVKAASGETTKEINEAFEECFGLDVQPKWITEAEALEYRPNKKDVFVVDPFEGPAFDYLARICVNHGRPNGAAVRREQCVRLIGPRCLLTCLQKNIPVPEMLYPIYNIAMYKLTITTTGFDPDTKADVQNKITLMGGGYLNAFHGHITHLIAASPGSEKYEVAVARNVPIMGIEWVDSVWKKSKTENVHATDSQFACCSFPVFRSLIICGSQMGKSVKQKLKEVVEKNGGKYMGKLYQHETSYLITPEAIGEKYISAKKWNIPCVKPDWIYDCVERGYLLDIHDYIMEQAQKCSTPQGSPQRDVQFDDTRMSTILPDQSCRNVQDTVLTEPDITNLKSYDWAQQLQDICGFSYCEDDHLLDGYKVYLMGFTDSQVDQIKKVLNARGATYYKRLRSTVSHIILPGQSSIHLVNMDKLSNKTKVVSILWLLDSCKNKEVQDEIDYLCCSVENEVLTPVKMTSSKKRPATFAAVNLDQDNHSAVNLQMNTDSMIDEDLLQQYTQCLGTQEVAVETKKLFKGLSFVMGEFISSGEIDDNICMNIEEYGGIVRKVVGRCDGKADYYVAESMKGEIWKNYATEVVSSAWLNDCWSQKEIIPVEYYHKPLPEPEDNAPLANCCVVLSGFLGWERLYLNNLIVALGSQYTEMLSKRDVPSQNVIAATHLICHQPSGPKYDAAASWGIPILNKDWLLECAASWRKLDISRFSLKETNTINLKEKTPEPVTAVDVRLANLKPDIKEKVLNMSTPKTPYGLHNSITQSSPSPFTRKVQKALLDSMPLAKRRCLESPPLREIVREGNQKWFPELDTKTQKPCREKEKTMNASQINDENNGTTPNHPSNLSKQLEVLMDEARRTVLLEKQNSTPRKKRVTRPKKLEPESQQDSDKYSEAQPSESQGGMITWDDPVRRSEMEKVGKNLSWPSSRVEQISLEALKYPKSTGSNFVFSISRITDDQLKQKLVSIVKSLGGVYIDGINYDPALTHIVTGATARSEKMLASIAAGKWVLKTDFLTMSDDQGYFVKEDEFEWGKDPKDSILSSMPQVERNLALAAHRWRCHYAENKKRPFQHIVGYLHMAKPQKTQSFVRVLEAGGGQISRAKLPLSSPLDTTHVFVDATKGLNGIDLEQLAKHRILCLDPYYLFDCLSMETELDVQQYMPADYLQFYRKFSK